MNKSLVKIKAQFLKVATALKKDPSELTRTEFLANGTILEWELRKLGGFEAVKSLLYPAETNIVAEAVTRNTRAYRANLNKKLGDQVFYAKQIQDTIREVLVKTPLKLHAPLKQAKATKNKAASRTLVAHLSDTHYGANIAGAEVSNLNEFSWEIAARRTALFMEQIANYKPQYRQDTDCVLMVNGDIIAGVIHDQEWFADLLATQFSGALSILSQGISYLGQHFKSVRVYCTTGNHGRAMHKSSKDRAMTHKWDSYETMLFIALKQVLEVKHKNIQVEIPQAPYAILDTQGHKIFVTHGDTVINVGNPGKALNIGSISNQINKVCAGLGKIDVVTVGHTHSPVIALLDNGVHFVNNGCLSGLDGFANGIGIFDSHPTQILWEATKEHAVGDARMIQLKSADKNVSLEKIIAPFKRPF
jgi:predicted phosphodiesterase